MHSALSLSGCNTVIAYLEAHAVRCYLHPSLLAPRSYYPGSTAEMSYLTLGRQELEPYVTL